MLAEPYPSLTTYDLFVLMPAVAFFALQVRLELLLVGQNARCLLERIFSTGDTNPKMHWSMSKTMMPAERMISNSCLTYLKLNAVLGCSKMTFRPA